MPEAHQRKGERETEVTRQVSTLKPLASGRSNGEAAIDVIPKPGGKSYVPAIPEVRDVEGEKWAIEIVRHPDPEKIPGPDGQGTVPGKIQEKKG